MKLIDYIKGDRRGREANELEREALRDPFLADAIEGFEAVKHENHFDRLIKLRGNIARRSTRNKHRTLYRTISATIGIAAAIGIGFGVWTMLPESKPDQIVMQEAMLAELEGATTIVGTTEELLAQARQQDAYCDVVITDSNSFIAEINNQQPATSNEQPENITPKPETNSSDINPPRQASPATPPQEGNIHNLDTVTNAAFVNYYKTNRKITVPGNIVMEFRVKENGKVAKIQVLAAPTQEAGREALNLLISGPTWTPTGDNRIRTVING